MIAREMAKRMQAKASKSAIAKKSMKMRHGTNDLRAAYRRVPTSQPEFTVQSQVRFRAVFD